MYLKWKRSELKRGGMRLQAEIFTSYRDETGKPRRKSVSYIGSVKERHLTGKFKERGYYEREKFWKGADWQFESLALLPEEEARFRAELEQRIPRPPAPVRPFDSWHWAKKRSLWGEHHMIGYVPPTEAVGGT